MQKEAMLYEKIDDTTVHCMLCAHECCIKDGMFGLCGVRNNQHGVLYSLVYGDPIALGVDPIEKKPLYHLCPGSSSFSLATIGCNFRCRFCQNWKISQITQQNRISYPSKKLLPDKVVEKAINSGCKSISYTYTEPTIFFEYAYDIAKCAHEKGLYNIFVTNGFMTPKALDIISPYLTAANVDLKSFSQEYYRDVCHAQLQPVLDSIKKMKSLGIWVEITTLIIPEENDSEKELCDIAEFIVSVDPNIPWHISRFFPHYQFKNYLATPIATLYKARDIGKKTGIRYVYVGNVAEESSTYCPECNERVIERDYTSVSSRSNGICNKCKTKIPGIWK